MLNQTLTIVYVSFPNSVAAHDYELIFGTPIELFDIGFAGDHLFVIPETLFSLIIEITE